MFIIYLSESFITQCKNIFESTAQFKVQRSSGPFIVTYVILKKRTAISAKLIHPYNLTFALSTQSFDLVHSLLNKPFKL